MAGTPRRTRQRSAVSEVLESTDEFHSAQEIHALLLRQGNHIGLATVYRTLQTLADAGDVDVVRSPDGQIAYRGCGQATGHHHHLICRSCGRAVEIEFSGVEEAIRGVAAAHGFSQVGHELELFGLCSDCGSVDASAGGL